MPKQEFLEKTPFDVERAFGGAALIALHEIDSLRAHAAALHERLHVAFGAHSATRFWREQRALARRTRRRCVSDHAVRRELWGGLLDDLRG